MVWRCAENESVHEALSMMAEEYKSFAFDIVQRWASGQRDFHICAETQEELEKWTQIINAAIPAVVCGAVVCHPSTS